jgi:hypothetical protein
MLPSGALNIILVILLSKIAQFFRANRCTLQTHEKET